MSRVEDILQCLINGDSYDGPVQSRVEEILLEDFDGSPLSRVEELLLALRDEGSYSGPVLSRIEDILYCKENDYAYEGPVLSRIEALFLEWSVNDLPDDYEEVKGFNMKDVHFNTTVKLSGADTLRFTFAYNNACNVIGAYLSAAADNNYSFYATSQSYMRYDGELYRPTISKNTKYEALVNSSGMWLNGDKVASWTKKNFTSTDYMMIGMLPNSQSSAFDGYFEGRIIVDGKLRCIPVKRLSDDALGYFDTVSMEFLEKQGSGTLSILS